MFVSQSDLTKCRRVAQANADTFQQTYYIIRTTMGFCVECERPTNADLIVAIINPKVTP